MSNDLIDRYVGATLRTVPESQRSDIEAELRASIEDALEARMEAGVDADTAKRHVLTEMGDPDRLGQAQLRYPEMSGVPDPLRSSLRSIAALTDARYVLVPAAVRYDGVEGQVRAELTLVLCDTRTGVIPWRTVARGEGTTAAEAFGAALESIAPPE